MGIYKDLSGKRVVITGGASGIGLATAKRFVDEGAKVVIIDWNKEDLEKISSVIPEIKGRVYADVSNPEDVKAAFKKIDSKIGRAHV